MPDPLQKILDLLHAERVTLHELHEISGDELGRNIHTLGWYLSDPEARKAAKDLGHGYWHINKHSGMQLPSGEVFLLAAREVALTTKTARDWVNEQLANIDMAGVVGRTHESPILKSLAAALQEEFRVTEHSAREIVADCVLDQEILKVKAAK
jgi:hypothetical protein